MEDEIAVGDLVEFPVRPPEPKPWVPDALRPPREPSAIWEVVALDPENGACVIERSVPAERDAFDVVAGVRVEVLWVFVDEVRRSPKAEKWRIFRL